MLVKFEHGMLHEFLKTAPMTFTQNVRNPECSFEIGGKSLVFLLAYAFDFFIDFEKGCRYGSIEDFRNFVKLVYAPSWLHHFGGRICEPVDVPVNKLHLNLVYSHIRYSDCGFMVSLT